MMPTAPSRKARLWTSSTLYSSLLRRGRVRATIRHAPAVVHATASVRVRPGLDASLGETRLDLIKKMPPSAGDRACGREAQSRGSCGFATNPVDALTYAAWTLAVASRPVIDSGTAVDTSRFRYLLSQHFGVDARSIHGYIIGEHGDSEGRSGRWPTSRAPLPEFCKVKG